MFDRLNEFRLSSDAWPNGDESHGEGDPNSNPGDEPGDGGRPVGGGNNGPTLTGTPIADAIVGGAGNDTIFGLQGGDYLVGLGGNDRIFGGSGVDILIGSAGDDTLVGGRDNDRLTGGTGDDVFVFTEGGGFDRVRDFEIGNDVLDVSRLAGVNTFADVTITDQAGGTLIVTDSGERIFLNAFHGTLTNNDFAF